MSVGRDVQYIRQGMPMGMSIHRKGDVSIWGGTSIIGWPWGGMSTGSEVLGEDAYSIGQTQTSGWMEPPTALSRSPETTALRHPTALTH